MIPRFVREQALGCAILGILAVPALAGNAIEEAKGLVTEGRYEDALFRFRKVEEGSPGHLEAILGQAEALEAMGRWEEAARVLDAALAAKPESVPLLVARGKVAASAAEEASRQRRDLVVVLKDVGRALRTLKAARALNPEDLGVRVLGARLVRWQEDIDPGEARRTLEEAVAEAPSDFDANLQMARYWYWMAGQDTKNKEIWTRAEAFYRASLEIRPACGTAVLQRTYCKQWIGKTQRRDLLFDYEKAADLLPDDPAPLVQIAKVASRPEDRLPILDRLLERHPYSALIFEHRARAFRDAGRNEEALASLAAAEKRYPRNPSPPLATANFLAASGEEKGAMEAYLRAVGLCGDAARSDLYDSIDAFAVRARGLAPQERDTLWTTLWKAFPGETNGLNNAQIWFRDTGKDIAKSLEWCERGLAADPHDLSMLNDTGLNLLTKGDPAYDPARAEEFFKRAVKEAVAQGNNSPILSVGYRNAVDNLVKLLLGQGRTKELAALAEEFLKDDPRYENVKALADGTGGLPSLGQGQR